MKENELTEIDGHYYNKFGSIVYPRLKDRKKIKIKSLYQTEDCELNRSYKEFEIQAVAYNNLRDFFKNDQYVKGEYTIKDGLRYLHCDIAIIDKNYQLVVIIEVKRSLTELSKEDVKYQIETYNKFASTLILSTMQEAENIVTTLFSKGYITVEKFNWSKWDC